MKQKTLSNCLKCILMGIGICGLLVCAVALPMYGLYLRTAYPEFSNRFWPWLIFLWASAIPCFTILAFAWKVTINIGKDQAFSAQNARLLKWISNLSAADSGFFFIGNTLLLLLNMSHPGILIASFAIVFIGLAATVVAAVLSHLVKKAAELQEQSDWTI